MIIVSLFDNTTDENYFITDKFSKKDIVTLTTIDNNITYQKRGLFISKRDISICEKRIIKSKDGIFINGIKLYCDVYTRKRIFKIIEDYDYKNEIEEETYDYLLKLENND